jgi:hypothetical protein
MQKCCTCKKYSGGCSWTKVDPETNKILFQPVPGWTAEPSEKHGQGYSYDTYDIQDCPEYEQDDLMRLSLEDQVVKMAKNGVSMRQIALHTGIMSKDRLMDIIEKSKKG